MSIVNHLKRCWKGEVRLWIVFWGWGVVGSIFLFYITNILWNYMFDILLSSLNPDRLAGSDTAFSKDVDYVIASILVGVFLLYELVVGVFLWRNSGNTKLSYMHILTRGAIIIVVPLALIAITFIWWLAAQRSLH